MQETSVVDRETHKGNIEKILGDVEMYRDVSKIQLGVQLVPKEDEPFDKSSKSEGQVACRTYIPEVTRMLAMLCRVNIQVVLT